MTGLETVLVAVGKRVWNPDQHPRDPATGRFIGKGLVGRKNGGDAKSSAIPGTSRSPAGKPPTSPDKTPTGKTAPPKSAPAVAPEVKKAPEETPPAKAPAKKATPAKKNPVQKPAASTPGEPKPLKKGPGRYRTLKPAQAQAMQDDMLQSDPWTNAQRDALRTYTGPEFKRINDALRGQSTSDAATDEDIGNVRAGMRGFPQNVTVSRDTDPKSFGFPGKKMTLKQAQTLVGKTFHDKGFLSTSTSPRAARQVRMQIDVPQGARGAYVDSISENRGENEVLLDRGSHFNITGAEQDDRGDIILHMSLVGQDGDPHPVDSSPATDTALRADAGGDTNRLAP